MDATPCGRFKLTFKFFFLSQNGEVHLIDLLEECFDGGEGGQGFVRARVFSPLLNFLKYLTYRSVYGFLYLPVSQKCAMSFPG